MTAFDLQIIGLIILAFVIGVIVGYLLRTRVFAPGAIAGDDGGVTLESRQARGPNALLRGSAGATTPLGSDDTPSQAGNATAQATPDEALEASAEDKTEFSGQPDNLQDIKGIGAVLEKQLNELGITRFEHIARWTEDDVARVNETLKFRGRIQRERWVEQAREFIARSRGGR